MVDWVALEAIGTLGAFGTGFYLVAKEREESRKRADDERKAQARLVSHWVEKPEDRIYGMGGKDWIEWRMNVVVNNDSTEPIYNAIVRGFANVPTQAGRSSDWKVVPPHSKSETYWLWTWPLNDPQILDWFDGVSGVKPDVLSYLTFHDSQGREWVRDLFGSLKLESGYPIPRWRVRLHKVWFPIAEFLRRIHVLRPSRLDELVDELVEEEPPTS